MLLYLTILIILTLFGTCDILPINKDQKKYLLFIILLLLIFQDGFRWETGSDWVPYYDFFYNKISIVKWSTFEPGYVLLNIAVYYLLPNYTCFLIIHAILIYFFYISSIKKYTNIPIITILIFYCSFIGYLGMNRQHIALAICLFSFQFIITKQFNKFLFWVLIATSFHLTAILFLFIYFLNRPIPKIFFVISILAAIILNPFIAFLFKQLLSNLPFFIAFKLKHALEDEATNTNIATIFGITKRVLIFVLLYIKKEKLKEIIPSIEVMLNVYFLSIIIYIMFNNSIQVFVGRGNLYFGSLFEIFLMPCFLFLVKKNSGRYIVYSFIIIIMFLTFFKGISYIYDAFIPYKGIFINQDYYRNLLIKLK
jgi:hypothetical protein